MLVTFQNKDLRIDSGGVERSGTGQQQEQAARPEVIPNVPLLGQCPVDLACSATMLFIVDKTK